MTHASLTATLAKFAVETSSASIPEATLERASMSFLDTLGIAAGGMRERAPQILLRHVRRIGARGRASVLGEEPTCDAAHAALVNGTAADIVGWSDISVVQMNHPSVSICPAVWAVGEERRATGRDVLAAHVIGTEVANKIGAAVKPGLQLRGWHPLAVLNTFGAAAAAGRLIELDVHGMQNAFGIAAGEASGMRVAMGTMSKAYGAGRAARDGIRAAALAAMGFTGPEDVLEARDGFLQTFGDGVSGEGLLTHLGAPFEFESPGITLKKFPACTRSHNGIQALLDLRARHTFGPDDVEQIECLVTPAVVDYLKYSRPNTAFEAKYSMEYCLAVVLLDGHMTVESFNDGRTQDPRVQRLMAITRMTVWDEYARHGYNPPHAPYGCRLSIHLRDGRVLTSQRDQGPWEPSTPPAWRDVEEKFRGNLTAVGEGRTCEIIAMVHELDRVPDISRLLALFAVSGDTMQARSRDSTT